MAILLLHQLETEIQIWKTEIVLLNEWINLCMEYMGINLFPAVVNLVKAYGTFLRVLIKKLFYLHLSHCLLRYDSPMNRFSKHTFLCEEWKPLEDWPVSILHERNF